MHPFLRPIRSITTLGLIIVVAAEVQAQAPIKASPFLPPASGNAAAQPGASAYEFAGMSVAGKATLLSIVRVRDKRSIWVPVGQTVGEISAISYDPKTDEATVRADGQLLKLSMRKSAVVSGPAARLPSLPPRPDSQPAQVSIPPMPANAQEEKETEARMLVTDLLEIGQAQRRAYEEAQRQAAAKERRSGSPARPAN